MEEARAHLVYLRSDRVLLVKRPGASWGELQDEYEDYMTSLGPWTAEQIAQHFSFDFGEDDSRWPFSRRAIEEFIAASGAEVLEV